MAKIMLVEDEVITAMGMTVELQSLGYDVCRPVATGEAALQGAAVEKPDAVIMDVNLHGALSGIEAARQIWSRFAVPVLFISGNADADTIAALRREGFAHYLLKPVSIQEVKKVLDELLCH
ncbi:MAG: response regulator [Pseudomonadota bacterium]